MRKFGAYIALLVFLLAAFYYSWGRKPEIDDLNASIFSSKRSGYMMFNDLAGRIGADVKALQRPLTHKDTPINEAVQLWLIAPATPAATIFNIDVPATDEETGNTPDENEESIQLLAQWVSTGGTLVVSPHYIFNTMLDPLLDRLGYSIVADAIAAPGNEKIRFILKPAGKDALLENINDVESYMWVADNSGTIFRFETPPDGTEVLLSDEHGPAVISHALGRGRIILISDQYIFSNFLLPSADNAQFAANILADAGGGLILFDEYNHGYERLRGLSDVFRTRAGYGLAFLIIVAGIALYSAARRFGAIQPPSPPGRRSPAQYVVSMGYLFRRAAASGLVLDVMERDFSRYLQERFRLPTLEPEEVEKRLRLIGHENTDEIMKVLEEFGKLKDNPRPHVRRLMKLSQRVDALKGA